MKCINCEMEWSGNEKIVSSITKCPFCGENPQIKKPEPKFYENTKDALKAIYKLFGADILLGKLNAYLPDIAPSISANDKELVYAVYNKGASKAFKENLSGTQEEKERAVKIAVRNLTEAYIAPEIAQRIVYEFTDALGWQIEKDPPPAAIISKPAKQTPAPVSKQTDEKKQTAKPPAAKVNKSAKQPTAPVSKQAAKQPTADKTAANKPADQPDEQWKKAQEYLSKGSYDLAIPILTSIAENGHIKAQVALADCYEAGKGVPQDYRKTAYWLRRAGNQGDITSKVFLDNLMKQGKIPADKGILKIDNNLYEGDIVNGVPHGKGKLTFSSGGIYEGDFVWGKRTGKGKLIFSDNTFYEGDFEDGNKTGKGKEVSFLGVYEGDFYKGKLHGKGKFTDSKGRIQEGQWEHGKFKLLSSLFGKK